MWERPVGGFRFIVVIDGLDYLGFSEVGGLESEIETMEYQEGGLNSFVHQFPVAVKYPPLQLKRGISDSQNAKMLWDWYNNYGVGIASVQALRNGSIFLLDQEGIAVSRWDFFYARPIAWHGPVFNAISNEVAIEGIDLVHQGIRWIY